MTHIHIQNQNVKKREKDGGGHNQSVECAERFYLSNNFALGFMIRSS